MKPIAKNAWIKDNWIEIIFWTIFLPLSTWYLFSGISRESIWFDESYSAAIIRHTFGEIWQISQGDSHPPLYFMALKWVSSFLGESISVLRGFSAAGVIALIILGLGPVRRIFGRYTAMAYAILILAVPGTLVMAQEMRMYTWAAFFVTGSVLFGYAAAAQNKPADWIKFGICSLLAGYTHYYAFLAVMTAGFIIGIALLIQNRKRFSVLLIAAGSAGILYLPWI